MSRIRFELVYERKHVRSYRDIWTLGPSGSGHDIGKLLQFKRYFYSRGFPLPISFTFKRISQKCKNGKATQKFQNVPITSHTWKKALIFLTKLTFSKFLSEFPVLICSFPSAQVYLSFSLQTFEGQSPPLNYSGWEQGNLSHFGGGRE